jgi:predicted membrane protein
MNTPMINTKRLLLVGQTALKVGAALLLAILLIGMFRLWVFVPALFVLTLFVSLFVLVVLLVARSNLFPFVPMCSMYGLLYDQLDPERVRMQYEETQLQEEDFKPFVFKDQVQQREQA